MGEVEAPEWDIPKSVSLWRLTTALLFKRRACRGARRRALMRNLNVSAAQGYRIERQTGNDRSARSGHPQAELIVPSRLAVVDDRGAERIVPHAVDRRLADDHSRIADDTERMHGRALELHR